MTASAAQVSPTEVYIHRVLAHLPSAPALRAQIATSAPFSAKASAIDRPMPRLPPPTRTFFPLNEISIGHSSNGRMHDATG